MKGHYQLIIGGARSGKSALAEQRALASGKSCVYLATGTPGDEEMALRIDNHRRRRGDEWLLVEEPLFLAQALLANHAQDRTLLVDCLTLWLSNCLHNQTWDAQRQQLLEILPTLSGEIILVSNEVGSGIVPLGELTRRFVDESGFLNQALASICHRVTQVVAGLPQELK